jgi:hypothetical protein
MGARHTTTLQMSSDAGVTSLRAAPLRPRWWRLYLVLGFISAAAAAVHRIVATPPILWRVVDAAYAVVVVIALVGWVHVNRVALARLEEPDAGSVAPQLRIVTSASDEAVSDAPLLTGASSGTHTALRDPRGVVVRRERS